MENGIPSFHQDQMVPKEERE